MNFKHHKSIFIILIAAFILLYCSNCFADSRYTEISSGDYMTVYLDKESLLKDKEDNSFDCWVKYLYSSTGQKHYKMGNTSYELMRIIFFPDRTIIQLSYLAYDKNDKLIEDYTFAPDELKNEGIPPETALEDVWKYLYKR